MERRRSNKELQRGNEERLLLLLSLMSSLPSLAVKSFESKQPFLCFTLFLLFSVFTSLPATPLSFPLSLPAGTTLCSETLREFPYAVHPVSFFFSFRYCFISLGLCLTMMLFHGEPAEPLPLKSDAKLNVYVCVNCWLFSQWSSLRVWLSTS